MRPTRRGRLRSLQTGAFTQAVTSGCPTIGTTINIPRHYYTIASVQFCDHIDTTVNGQWKGFGTGACQANNDLQQHPVAQYGKFTRIGLVNDGRTYPYTDQVTGAASSRSYAQEIINYANWFAYYRLRAHAAKTTSTLAFNLLDPTYRVGFHILGTEPTPIGNGLAISWVDVKDFTLAQRTAFWTALFAVPTVTTNKTPTMSAMLRIGNLFETGGTGGLPGSVNVSGAFSAAKDPFDKDSNNNLISCANNYHILFTDGFTQQIALPAVAGEKDDTIPAAWPLPGTLPDGSNNPDNVLPDLPVATAWPAPFKWGTKAVPDTLADVSMYYWARDLRPALTNNVPSWSGKTPGDIDPTKDVAWWQHVNFSAISFGAAGTLDAGNQAATLSAISGGTEQWPDVTAPNNPPLPPSNKGAVAVDDLWHAAVNARGTFVYAKSPLEVQYGLATILAGIRTSASRAPAQPSSGTVLSATNNIIYEATIEPGWSGDVLKVQIDPVTAAEVATLWQAGQQLSDQIRPTSPTDEPWMDETKRRIVTWNGATRVGFRETAGSLPPLSAAQMTTLSPDPVTQKKMVHYLRGGNIVNMPLAPVNGFVIEGTGIGEFRSRYGRAPACPLCAPAKPFAGGASLGDISNAAPLVVSAPIQDVFYETSDPGYFNFSHVTAAGRPDVVVAAANDGMVHVIDSADGHEIFAYVPSSLLRSAGAPDFAVDSAGKPTGLQALTFQDGGVPIYKHHFYVDSSPRSVNVDFNSAGVKGGADDWHTIVVGGMGKGGKSYYAFDLTDANVTTEAEAGAKLLWEITDPDWRYTYGRPVIVKTYAFGWTVIVTSGYNNVSEEGRIYFFDPKTGSAAARADECRQILRRRKSSGPRADQRLHQGLPQPVRRADLRRRSLRQHVALQHLRPEFGELDGRQVRGAEGPERHGSAGHHRPANRDRLRQRRQPLRLHRHRATARRNRPDRADAGAAADAVGDPRRVAVDADALREPADQRAGGADAHRGGWRGTPQRAERLVPRPADRRHCRARRGRRGGRRERHHLHRDPGAERPVPHRAACRYLRARIRERQGAALRQREQSVRLRPGGRRRPADRRLAGPGYGRNLARRVPVARDPGHEAADAAESAVRWPEPALVACALGRVTPTTYPGIAARQRGAASRSGPRPRTKVSAAAAR